VRALTKMRQAHRGPRNRIGWLGLTGATLAWRYSVRALTKMCQAHRGPRNRVGWLGLTGATLAWRYSVRALTKMRQAHRGHSHATQTKHLFRFPLGINLLPKPT